MQDIPITDARSRLGELADQVKISGDPIILTKNGKATAGIVPLRVVEFWQGMQDADYRVLDEIWNLNPDLNMTEDEIMLWAVGAVHEARKEIEIERTRSATVGAAPNGQDI